MRRWLLLLLLFLVAGCTAVGDFCHDDSDCPGLLRCSAREGDERGICTYPLSDGGAD
jgi:hypothetical protein